MCEFLVRVSDQTGTQDLVVIWDQEARASRGRMSLRGHPWPGPCPATCSCSPGSIGLKSQDPMAQLSWNFAARCDRKGVRSVGSLLCAAGVIGPVWTCPAFS